MASISNLHSFDTVLPWGKLGPRAEIGNVKLQEKGRCRVFGVEGRAVPNRAILVRCNEDWVVAFKYDGADWYASFFRTDPELQTEEEMFQEIREGFATGEVQVFETCKTLAEEKSGGRGDTVIGGLLLMAAGVVLHFVLGWTLAAVLVGGLGVFSVWGAIVLGRVIQRKYIVVASEFCVVEVKAAKFEAEFLDSLKRQQVEGVVQATAA
jgi:hypothetical protein